MHIEYRAVIAQSGGSWKKMTWCIVGVFVLCLLWTAVESATSVSSVLCNASHTHAGGWMDTVHRPLHGEEYCPFTLHRALWHVHFDICTEHYGELLTQPNLTFALPTHYKPVRAAHMLQTLRKHNATIFLVGDSLQMQILSAIHCICENEGISPLSFNESIHLERSFFLSQLSSPYHIEEPRFDLQDIQSELWVADILQHHARTKIAVLNSGPWWTPSRIFHASSNTSVPVQDLMAAYAHHFSPKGRLHTLAATLHAHRVLLVWRDVTPAGECHDGALVTSQWTAYYEHFAEMNQIGRRFVLQHGGVVLPHIWDASLSHSAEHVFGPNADALHWCNYRPWSLPWIWATVLYNELDALLAKATAP